MKTISIFHALVFFMAVLIFSMPFVTVAQQISVPAEAIAAAEADANKDVSKPLWFGAGCVLFGLFFLSPGPYGYLLPPVGLIGSYFYQPAPPPLQLIGKSPEYIAAYISAYQSKRGNIQAQWASAGCLGGCLAVVTVTVGIGIGIRIGAEAATQ